MGERHSERHVPAGKTFLEKAAIVVAPGTVILGLLYYLGRTRINAYYSELGLSVSELGLTYQDYLLASPNAVFLPLWILLLVGLGALMVYAYVERGLARPAKRELRRRTYRVAGAVGGVMLLVAFGTSYVWRGWSGAPLLGVIGAALALFGLALKRGGTRAFAAGHARGRERLWTVVGGVLMAMLTLSAFSSVAWWVDREGRESARDEWRDGLGEHPGVVVYTSHMVLGKPDRPLAKQYEPLRYAYDRFAVLASSNERYYLVPRRETVDRVHMVRRDDPEMRVVVLR